MENHHLDANTENQGQVTENQIQVLCETEMLATQGFGDCEYVVNEVAPANTEPCGNKQCYYIEWVTIWVDSTPYLVDIYGVRTGVAHNRCKRSSDDKDCVDIVGKKQKCATVTKFIGHECMNYYTGPHKVEVTDVKERDGCFRGGGGMPTGSTTS